MSCSLNASWREYIYICMRKIFTKKINYILSILQLDSSLLNCFSRLFIDNNKKEKSLLKRVDNSLKIVSDRKSKAILQLYKIVPLILLYCFSNELDLLIRVSSLSRTLFLLFCGFMMGIVFFFSSKN